MKTCLQSSFFGRHDWSLWTDISRKTLVNSFSVTLAKSAGGEEKGYSAPEIIEVKQERRCKTCGQLELRIIRSDD